jgi:hypothetical protein
MMPLQVLPMLSSIGIWLLVLRSSRLTLSGTRSKTSALVLPLGSRMLASTPCTIYPARTLVKLKVVLRGASGGL